MDVLTFLGRSESLFAEDFRAATRELQDRVRSSKILVVGGGGTIGRAVAKLLFEFRPAQLHICDISENGLVELVRDIRSSLGYLTADFETFVVDCLSRDFERLLRRGRYDYILNLAALKHVRSESDTFTLARMIEVNVLSVLRTLEILSKIGCRRYFSVSTDKSVNPANLMGATKGLMEQVMWLHSDDVEVTSARFANVAFSDGSLLAGFVERMRKQQPLSAPVDVKRYFITDRESAELCMLACFCAENRDVLVPQLGEEAAGRFDVLAERYIRLQGYEPARCETEEEGRTEARRLIAQRRWPCFFFQSDTTGEKELEEFWGEGETPAHGRFRTVLTIRHRPIDDTNRVLEAMVALRSFVASGNRQKQDAVEILRRALPQLVHLERGKYLNDRM